MIFLVKDGFMMRVVFSLISGLLMMVSGAVAGTVYDHVPDNPPKDANYIIYSHGLIVEGTDERPVHPDYGVYEFPAIKDALSEPDFTVIAVHRPAGIAAEEHSKVLVKMVRDLIVKGVKPAQITLVGFSQGGYITGMASAQLSDTPIDTVIMAACWSWTEKQPDVKLNGNFLSIYERSDAVGSCKRLADRSDHLKSFKEVEINTGKKHGAFFQPRDAWLNPIKEWIGEIKK
ncbi:MAG: alpha/beta hydrolase [Alphaproteobacteria bacterium]|nr:alpha/beta hydrolase [Alphaproteobacteria bacterium]HPF47837.1 hypothetical protein [Emcibacteraceae bacterium]